MPERENRVPGWSSRLLRWWHRRRFLVADRSMVPTFVPGDRLYVDRRAYRGNAPAPGDVVVVRDPELPSRFLVKRVAPIPTAPSGAPASRDSIYLVGDDPTSSRDSRQFGPVPTRFVLGRVYQCYSPPEHRREL